jgi:hypothetical protein
LYGWLNRNKPGWETTIGKVINDEVLFSSDLTPQTNKNTTPFTA